MSTVEELIARSNRLGSDPRNTNYAGGNTSAKGTAADPVTGADVELLWVKGSGGDLGTLQPDGLAVLRLDRLRALADVYPGVDREDEMVAAFDFCLHGLGGVVGSGPAGRGAAPSIDTAMHGLLIAPHVDHLHPDSGIALATSADGEKLTSQCFGDRVVWVPWRRPGFQLGLDIAAIAAANPQAIGCILGGHGITAWGQTSDECEARSLEIIRTAEAFIEDVVARLRELHEAYREDYAAYYQRYADPDSPAMRGADPAIVLVPGIGMFSFGANKQTARVAGEFYVNAINVMRGAEALSSYAPIDEAEKFRIEYWAPEEAKLKRLPKAKPLAARIALVTGAGSGIGRAIALRLAAEGACVVVADRDADSATAVAGQIGLRDGTDIAVPVTADVTDEDQVAAAVAVAALSFGGVDLVVNNAGLSISKPLLETTAADWDIQHDVMARGSFLVSREAARAMKAQRMGGDIVYICSKNSVFAGPNNVAYGAAKADQAHQVRLLAAELGADGIRVNGINPDGVVRGSGIFAGGWGAQRAEVYGVGLFPRLRAAGELAGPVIGAIAADLGLPRPPQVVVGPSHDTAAAVVGIPARDDAFAFVCTGTWALAGVELAAPVITSAAREAGFSNEVGIDATIRFLRNVTGFWLLQECVREWESEGRRVDLGELTGAASKIPGLHALIDVQDPLFAAPGGMTERIIRACRMTSGVSLSADADILRCILDSMAVAIRHAVRDAARLTGRPVNTVHVNGGGVANPLFCQLVANACGLPTMAGPTEAASWGNVLVQARALGLAGRSLPELRSLVRRSVHLTRYEPDEQEAAWERADEVVLASRAPVLLSRPCSN